MAPEEAKNFEAERAKTNSAPKATGKHSDPCATHFSRVALWWLGDPAFHKALPPQARMLLFLWCKTQRGSSPVYVTRADAVFLRVADNKMRTLRELERHGLIRITTHGTALPLVTMTEKLTTTSDHSHSRLDDWLWSLGRGFFSK